jgi:hypothetical protein
MSDQECQDAADSGESTRAGADHHFVLNPSRTATVFISHDCMATRRMISRLEITSTDTVIHDRVEGSIHFIAM